MAANPKRSTGKSKRRWKALQTKAKWIPYIAIQQCNLQGDWEKDIMRMCARDRNFDPWPKNAFACEEFNKAFIEMSFCGTSFMLDGKHISISEIFGD